MNPMYLQLGIAVLLELARRRAVKDDNTDINEAILNMRVNPKDELPPSIKLGVVAYLSDVVEDILKAVKP